MPSPAANEPIASNATRLLWAGFLAILAAGIGFGIRGGILANWGAEFGFTSAELGAITGAGFTGFCFGIIIGTYSSIFVAAPLLISLPGRVPGQRVEKSDDEASVAAT